jgi:bifunctional non-homologous end joining protein LigD
MARTSLREYLRKRDFTRTPEPVGKRGGPRKGEQNTGIFVAQKHAARRLHYDLRLEIDGVLASWAMPKGPSLDPADKRLAVRTEDHPLEYAKFEGTIPEGEYGAGTVMIWDQGTYVAEGDPAKGLAEGKLSFRLNGKRLKGDFTLVQLQGARGRGGRNWLVVKQRDAYADGHDVMERATTSVKSGLTMEEIEAHSRAGRTRAAGATRQAASRREPTRRASGERRQGKALRAKPRDQRAEAAGTLPRFLPPELAILVEEPPEGEGWLHETKYDGYPINRRGRRRSGSALHPPWQGLGRSLPAPGRAATEAAAQEHAAGWGSGGDGRIRTDRFRRAAAGDGRGQQEPYLRRLRPVAARR